MKAININTHDQEQILFRSIYAAEKQLGISNGTIKRFVRGRNIVKLAFPNSMANVTHLNMPYVDTFFLVLSLIFQCAE